MLAEEREARTAARASDWARVEFWRVLGFGGGGEVDEEDVGGVVVEMAVVEDEGGGDEGAVVVIAGFDDVFGVCFDDGCM